MRCKRPDVRPVSSRRGHPGARPRLRRRADPVRGPGGARGRPARRRRRRAQEARDRARAVRHQHAARPRRHRRQRPPAGPGPGAGRPGHQRPRLGRRHPAVLVPAGRHRRPDRALPAAHRPGRARGVLRDHRGVGRLRRGRHRGHRPPRRRRVGTERRQVARDQLQLRRLLLLPGQEDRDQSVRTHAWLRVRAQRRSRHRAAPSHRGISRPSTCCSWSTCPAPASPSSAPPPTRTRSATTTRSSSSPTSASPPPTSSAAKAAACSTPANGSASSG